MPVLGVFDGLDLSGGVITGPELEPYIQQALDEIEVLYRHAMTAIIHF